MAANSQVDARLRGPTVRVGATQTMIYRNPSDLWLLKMDRARRLAVQAERGAKRELSCR